MEVKSNGKRLNKNSIELGYYVDSPLLREITTINPIEYHHSMVRRYTNRYMNLKECTIKIVELIEKRYETAQQVQLDSHSKVSRVAALIYNQMESWPLPYQLLVGREITRAEKMISDGSWKFQWFQTNLNHTCRCKSFKSQRLPCKHIFIKDLICNKSWITQEKWKEWTSTCV